MGRGLFPCHRSATERHVSARRFGPYTAAAPHSRSATGCCACSTTTGSGNAPLIATGLACHEAAFNLLAAPISTTTSYPVVLAPLLPAGIGPGWIPVPSGDPPDPDPCLHPLGTGDRVTADEDIGAFLRRPDIPRDTTGLVIGRAEDGLLVVALHTGRTCHVGVALLIRNDPPWPSPPPGPTPATTMPAIDDQSSTSARRRWCLPRTHRITGALLLKWARARQRRLIGGGVTGPGRAASATSVAAGP